MLNPKPETLNSKPFETSQDKQTQNLKSQPQNDLGFRVLDLGFANSERLLNLIDTHSHLQFGAYDSDREEVIKRALANSIVCINVGVDVKTSQAAVELAEKYPNFYAAIGLHPTDVDEPLDVEVYKRLALSASRRVVAIGEIGLDFFRKPFDATKQKNVFLEQLALAKELNLPVVIHCRAAHDQMIGLLQGQNVRGVIHCFTGTLEQAQKYVNLGFLLGINGIMFKFNIDKVVQQIPLEKLVLETDCPFLTPVGAPSKRNESLFIEYVVQRMAELRGISTEEVSQQTTQNAKHLFGI